MRNEEAMMLYFGVVNEQIDEKPLTSDENDKGANKTDRKL